MPLSAKINLTRESEATNFLLELDFNIPSDGITALFGSSGSGKTSLLRCIAGLEENAIATIRFKNDLWQNHEYFLPTHERRIGLVFQRQNLFPHLSSRQNIEFAEKRVKSNFNNFNVDSVIDNLEIEPLLNKYPAQMSGGEQQLVALARTLKSGPALLLMDEPLSSLDDPRKNRLLEIIKNLNTKQGLPILYVTHSVDEVLKIADHLLMIENGKLSINKPLMEAFDDETINHQVWPHIGAVIEARLTSQTTEYGMHKLEFQGGNLWIPDSNKAIGFKTRLVILARDISIALSNHTDTSILNKVQAVITKIQEDANPAFLQIHSKAGPNNFRALVTKKSFSTLELETGKSIWLQIKSVAIST